MRTRNCLTTAASLATGALFGWLTATGWLHRRVSRGKSKAFLLELLVFLAHSAKSKFTGTCQSFFRPSPQLLCLD